MCLVIMHNRSICLSQLWLYIQFTDSFIKFITIKNRQIRDTRRIAVIKYQLLVWDCPAAINIIVSCYKRNRSKASDTKLFNDLPFTHSFGDGHLCIKRSPIADKATKSIRFYVSFIQLSQGRIVIFLWHGFVIQKQCCPAASN